MVLERRLENKLLFVLEELSPYRSTIEGIVVESPFNWYWPVDGLGEAGYAVHLAKAAAIQQYERLKFTDDYSNVC